jgi:HSP20 family protein
MKSSRDDKPYDRSHPLERLRDEVENVFDQLSSGWHDLESSISEHLPEWIPGVRKPRTDASETADIIEFRVEMPGLEPEDIDVSVEDGVLTINGERETQTEEKERNYYLRERSSQKFYRSFALPADIRGDEISANCKNGVLVVRIPRSEPRKSRVQKVKVET